MNKERLEELQKRVFADCQEWDVKCSQDGFQEASPTGEMDADGKDLTALIDAEIVRQSVTDEAVQRAIEQTKLAIHECKGIIRRADYLESVAALNYGIIEGREMCKVSIVNHNTILRALRQMRTEPCEWVACSERMPDDNVASVLIYSKAGGIAEGQYYPSIESWKQFRWSVENVAVTHWMPLPEPPKGE